MIILQTEQRESPDGSLPLENQRHEAFARERARGLSLAQAWLKAAPEGPELSPETCKANGWRCQSRPEVSARIKGLAQERAERIAEGRKSLARPDAMTIMGRVSDVLKATYEAAKGVGAPDSKLALIRRTWSSHVARMSKMSPRSYAQDSDDDQFSIWSRIRGCPCS